MKSIVYREFLRSIRDLHPFISNYSWLDGLSFTGMRERYLEAFDAVRIDNLHGDRIISEYAPDGRTSETVFALRGQSPGIKVGTSVALLSRSGTVVDSSTIRIRIEISIRQEPMKDGKHYWTVSTGVALILIRHAAR